MNISQFNGGKIMSRISICNALFRRSKNTHFLKEWSGFEKMDCSQQCGSIKALVSTKWAIVHNWKSQSASKESGIAGFEGHCTLAIFSKKSSVEIKKGLNMFYSVMNNGLEWEIRNLSSNSCSVCYIPFRANILWQFMNLSLLPPPMGWIAVQNGSYSLCW